LLDTLRDAVQITIEESSGFQHRAGLAPNTTDRSRDSRCDGRGKKYGLDAGRSLFCFAPFTVTHAGTARRNRLAEVLPPHYSGKVKTASLVVNFLYTAA